MLNIIRKKYLNKSQLPKRFNIKQKKPKFLFNTKDNIEESIKSISLSTYNSNNEDKKNCIELLFSDELIIILLENSEIILYDIITKKTKKILCFSTITNKAKSLYLNQLRKTLLITYITKRLDLNRGYELKLTEIKVNDLKEKSIFKINDFTKLIDNESMVTPAFLEFDDYNKVILTMNSLGTYKIWNLSDYSKKMEITDKRIEETRLANDSFIVIKTLSLVFRMYLQIYDIRNGKILYNFEIELIQDCSVSFIEIFGNVLFLKQVGHLPMLINLLTIDTYFLNDDISDDTLFIYAPKHKIAFGFNKKNIIFFDLKGNILKKILNIINYQFLPKDIFISNDENFLAICWGVNLEENYDSSNKSNSSNSSLYTIKRGDYNNNYNSENSFLSSFSKSNFDMNDPFNCQVSEVKKRNNNLNKIDNTGFSHLSSIIPQFEYHFKFEIFDLNDLSDKGIKFTYLPKGVKNSKIVLNQKYMKGFFVTDDGGVYEIDF